MRYRARWKDRRGRSRELIFDSLDSLMVARIDFKLQVTQAFEGEPIPERYEMEEVPHGGDQGTYCSSL